MDFTPTMELRRKLSWIRQTFCDHFVDDFDFCTLQIYNDSVILRTLFMGARKRLDAFNPQLMARAAAAQQQQQKAAAAKSPLMAKTGAPETSHAAQVRAGTTEGRMDAPSSTMGLSLASPGGIHSYIQRITYIYTVLIMKYLLVAFIIPNTCIK